MVESVAAAKRINPDIRILLRCNYTSTGMRARKAGADRAVIAEQLVARELFRLAEEHVQQWAAAPQRELNSR